MSITPIANDVVAAGMQEEIGQSMSPAKESLNRENPALAEFIANSIEEKKIRDRMGSGYTLGQDSRGRSKGLIDLLNNFNANDPNALLSTALAGMTLRNDSMGKSGGVEAWARATGELTDSLSGR
jgi:hypothetical protein